jgi:hypothetical protein
VTAGARVAIGWARLYTRGMPATRRRARLDELASDLWEHAHDGGRAPYALQLEIAGRTLRGAPSDVAWRFTQRSQPLGAVAARCAGWALFTMATVFLLAFTAWSAAPVLGVYRVEDWAPGDAREFARVTGAIFLALAGGLAVLARLPRVGTALVVVATGGLALYQPWAWPVLVPCATSCAAGAAALARRTTARCR